MRCDSVLLRMKKSGKQCGWARCASGGSGWCGVKFSWCGGVMPNELVLQQDLDLVAKNGSDQPVRLRLSFTLDFQRAEEVRKRAAKGRGAQWIVWELREKKGGSSMVTFDKLVGATRAAGTQASI